MTLNPNDPPRKGTLREPSFSPPPRPVMGGGLIPLRPASPPPLTRRFDVALSVRGEESRPRSLHSDRPRGSADPAGLRARIPLPPTAFPQRGASLPPPSSVGAARGPCAQRLTLNPEPGAGGGTRRARRAPAFFPLPLPLPALCACSPAAGTAGRCSSPREGPGAQDKRPSGRGGTTTPRVPRAAGRAGGRGKKELRWPLS